MIQSSLLSPYFLLCVFFCWVVHSSAPQNCRGRTTCSFLAEAMATPMVIARHHSWTMDAEPAFIVISTFDASTREKIDVAASTEMIMNLHQQQYYHHRKQQQHAWKQIDMRTIERTEPLTTTTTTTSPPVARPQGTNNSSSHSQKNKHQQQNKSASTNRNNYNRWELKLYNDENNYEFWVAAQLVKIAGLTELQAFETMKLASATGEATIGSYGLDSLELAEHYHQALVTEGLSVKLLPLEA